MSLLRKTETSFRMFSHFVRHCVYLYKQQKDCGNELSRIDLSSVANKIYSLNGGPHGGVYLVDKKVIIIFTDAYCNINLWFEIGVVLFLTVVEEYQDFPERLRGN